MKAYFDEKASVVIEAENHAEYAALILWYEVNASNGYEEHSFSSVVDSQAGQGLILKINGKNIFDIEEGDFSQGGI